MTVLFIQGAGADVHDEWDDKLVASLARALGGTEIRYPRMPGEADPHYAAWKPAILRELADLDDGALVVGHSLGGTMLIHALAERPPTARLGGIFLVAAPYIGEGGWPSEELTPDADLSRLPAHVPVFLYHGTADETAPFAHLALYARAIPQAQTRAIPGADHQLGNDLGVVAFDLTSSRSSPTR